jgi:hypothetical protein
VIGKSTSSIPLKKGRRGNGDGLGCREWREGDCKTAPILVCSMPDHVN